MVVIFVVVVVCYPGGHTTLFQPVALSVLIEVFRNGRRFVVLVINIIIASKDLRGLRYISSPSVVAVVSQTSSCGI